MFLNKCNQQATSHNIGYEEMDHSQSALAKPFLKWAGGKGQLLHEINFRYQLYR